MDDNYNSILNRVGQMLSEVKSHYTSDDLPETRYGAVYDFAMKILLRDLIAEVGMLGTFGEFAFAEEHYTIPFIDAMEYAEEAVSFEDMFVLSPMWRKESINDAIFHLTKDCFHLSKNHSGILYKELNLLVVTNGVHHTQVADIQHSGGANVRVVHLADWFNTVSTNGYKWFNLKTGEEALCARQNWRISVLYELAKRKAKTQEYTSTEPSYKSYHAEEERFAGLEKRCEYLKNQRDALLTRIHTACTTKDWQPLYDVFHQEK